MTTIYSKDSTALSLDKQFPNAQTYHNFLPNSETVHDKRAEYPQGAFSERHLHCLWFDNKLRPSELKTTEGERVEVLFPGRWNLEAGPDFIGAQLKLANNRMLEGDVEIHIHANDWKNHGHDQDPNYDRVLFHVTYYPPTQHTKTENFPSIHIALKESLDKSSGFHFENIDLSAYPYQAKAAAHPLHPALTDLDPDDKTALLEAAGELRLRNKAKNLFAAIQHCASEQVLYTQILRNLGYKHNQQTAETLAEALPLHALREYSTDNPTHAYALLLGIANLIPREVPAASDPELQDLLKEVWTYWWKEAEHWEGRMLPPTSWTLAFVRPSNHPQRRLLAAAYLFTQNPAFEKQIIPMPNETPKVWIKRMQELLCSYPENLYSNRLSLHGKESKTPITLLGKPRANAIIINTLVPFLAATEQGEKLFAENLLNALPSEAVNSIITDTAHRLFGPDHSSTLYRSALARQGLIQIGLDHPSI